jgi:hypothetical protein
MTQHGGDLIAHHGDQVNAGRTRHAFLVPYPTPNGSEPHKIVITVKEGDKR